MLIDSHAGSEQGAIRRSRAGGWLRRCGLVSALGAVLVGLTWFPGTTTAHAAPTVFDSHAFELQVMEQINQARQNPKGMEAALRKSNAEADWYHNKIEGSTSRVQVDRGRDYYRKATDEAGQQTALPPLVWSEKLATLARNWVNADDGLAHGDLTGRSVAAGVDGYPHIEAIEFGVDRDPRSVVYGFWVSDTDNWKLNSTFHPDLSYRSAAGTGDWRGHRGIVNDASMNAIGVACLPRTSEYNEPIVKCVIDDGFNLPDAPAASAKTTGGTPSLDKLPATISGSVGQTTLPGQTVTVDTAAAPSQNPTGTTAPASASPPDSPPLTTSAPTGSSASGGGQPTCPAAGAKSGNLVFGETFDAMGDGCLLISVSALAEATPGSDWKIDGTPTKKYRVYEIKYNNVSTKTFNGSELAKLTCRGSTSASLLPVVTDGKVLKFPDTVARPKQTLRYTIACGSDSDDGYARINLDLSADVGGARGVNWAQTRLDPTGSASSQPAPPAATAATTGPCPDATKTGQSDATAGMALHCVIDAGRAAAGRPALKSDSTLDSFAQIAAGGNRTQQFCPGQSGNKLQTSLAEHAGTAQAAYQVMKGTVLAAPGGTSVGAGMFQGTFAIELLTC